jgi:hypothetical protein
MPVVDSAAKGAIALWTLAPANCSPCPNCKYVSFVGQSDVKDLEQALGQYVLYRQILNEMGIERILYLAVSRPTVNSVFTIELGQILLKNQIIRMIVFDDEREAIAQWIPD